MIKHIIVDTGYLLERYKIAGKKTQKCWTEEGHKAVTKKFDEEEKLGSRFYFPIPVLFELATHINDATNKQQVLHHLTEIIDKTQEDTSFWFIRPCSNAEDMTAFIKDLIAVVNRFTNEFNEKNFSLTNVSIIAEVQCLEEKLKDKKHIKRSDHKIHIWTRNRALKGKEPDEEENPFV